MLVFGGSRVSVLGTELYSKVSDIYRRVKVGGIQSISIDDTAALMKTFENIHVAMRIDLGVDTLDQASEHWFRRSQGEVAHAKIMAHRAGLEQS